MINKTISHYKIIEELGRGGMGVVYKAEDTKLKRTVALKFLPIGLDMHEPERARFLQEAQAAAALNHPNVCTVYDVAMEKDQQFIIMEYVDGKTLRQMVPVQKLQDAIDYAIQIGEALQEAHSKGVVHRDVKTDNIMVNTRNQVKVADFGLAKLKGSLKLTKTSSTVGTLAYMSPEQIQGTEVDARSDIFSFGVVLYEMLTGHLPFPGEYEAAIMYSIVNEEPLPVHKYRPEISSEVLHILNRSLEKDPEERYQTVHDVVIDLKRVRKENAHTPRPVPPRPDMEQQSTSVGGNKASNISGNQFEEKSPSGGDKKRRKRFVFMTATVCFFVLLTAFIFLKPFSEKPLPPLKIVPFTGLPGSEFQPSFSPDGSQIAFTWFKENEFNIYVKLIGAPAPVRLTTKPGADVLPVWSPDGHTVAFQKITGKEKGIYKIPAIGGTEQRIILTERSEIGWSMDWSPDGESLVYTTRDSDGALVSNFILSLSTLEKRQLSFPPPETLGDTGAKVSPNNQWIAFMRSFSYAAEDIFIIPFSGGKVKRITFDNKNISDLAWSQDGREIIFISNRGGMKSLWRVPFKGGEPKPVMAGGENAESVAISRKGQKLAYSKSNASQSILKGRIPKMETQIASNSKLIDINLNHFGGWFSPDGRKITFQSSASGSTEIWVCDSDGSNSVPLTNFGGSHTGSPRWSPDNRHIAFDSRPQGNSDIFIMNAEGAQQRRMTTESSDDRIPTWSRDGHWIYFTSNRSGSDGIWKLPLDGGEAIQVSKERGICNFESKDGKWLFYIDNNGNIWKLSLKNGEKQIVLKDIYSCYNWVLAEDGIYYIKDQMSAKESYKESSLGFLSFASNSMKKLARLKQKFVMSLDISPDRGSFLITDEELGESDIYLVENFR